ncbi:SRPBCC domain-containing protein [Pseudarthrobacter sp. J1738]|uniref:SRPBCC domain-containing protein n=1 Tax=Pseudarthrobacter sp. J1738 TaxID=3420446 RepID=UPI003D26DA72
MENIFSHAPGPQEPAEELDPVITEVTVGAPVAQAFIGFTEHTHLWWPLAEFGVYGEDSHVEFEENLILETADDGRTNVWGSIDDWQPPLNFRAVWHPGKSAVWSSEIIVAFRPLEKGTEVRVTHLGFEGVEDPQTERESYLKGWPVVLAAFVRFMGGPATVGTKGDQK